MEGGENLFEAPKAPLEGGGIEAGERLPIYSPAQIATGAFLGGPIPAIYFLHANFAAMAKDDAARNTLIGGALFVIALMGVIPFQTDRAHNMVIPIVYTYAARELAKRLQLTKADIAAAPSLRFQSSLKVALVTVIGFSIFMALIIAEVFLVIPHLH